MIYIPCFSGGMCNNILQFNNILHFLKKYNLDIDLIKINNVHTNVRDINIKITLFDKFQKYYGDYKNILRKKPHIIYNSEKQLDIKKNVDYVLNPCFYTPVSNHKAIYEYLDIKNKQKDISIKFKDVLNNLICFHIRRGDFLKHKVLCQKVLSNDKIIHDIKKNLNSKILILTNPESVTEIKNITKDFKNIIYAYDLNLPLDEEFLLGSICKKIIGTPWSTFSNALIEYNRYYKDNS